MVRTTTIPGFCTLCRSRCGTLNHIRQDRLIAVQPLGDHPTGRGTCAKGRAAPELVDHPERILHPLKRTRPKDGGDPGWVQIGWDEALDEIASRLGELRATQGAESVAFAVTTPSGTPMSDSIDWVERFIRLYGSPNTVYGTEICNWHKDIAHQFTFGCGMPNADYANAELNILWGHNPSHVWLSQAGELAAGKQNGARLLVIDPRETAHARQADLWLPVRPGTDGALALALANYLLSSEKYDAAFVRQWSNAPFLVDDLTGEFLRDPQDPSRFLAWHNEKAQAIAIDTRYAIPPALGNELALFGQKVLYTEQGQPIHCRPALDHYSAACAEWTLHRAAEVTGLTPEAITQAGDMLADAGPAISYHGWTGIGQHTNATQTERAIATLYALTGSFDRPGGNRRWTTPPVNQVNDPALLAETQRKKALGLAARPLGPADTGWVTAEDMYLAIEEGQPYPIEALFCFGSNFLVSQPDPERGEKALSQLGFHVHCDLFHSPTNAYADILLPVNTPWEREGLRTSFEINADAARYVQLRQAMVPSRGESRADYQIALDLACRLGMQNEFFQGDIEQGWNHILEPLGLDVATLRLHPEGIRLPLEHQPQGYAKSDAAGQCQGFATPTRRVEFYSQRLADHGYPPVPQYVSPQGAKSAERPLTLVTVKNGHFCHSQHRQLSSLRRRSPEPMMWLSPTLAQRKGLSEGSWGEVVGEQGTARLRVQWDESLQEDVVVTEYGWWQACDDLGRPAYPLHGRNTSNINAIISAHDRDPLSGALPLRSAPCDVRPVNGGASLEWSGFRQLRVVSKVAETEDVASLWLEPLDGRPLPPYLPGQHASLRFTLNGQPVVRTYSLSGPAGPEPQARYRISVRRSEAADASASVSHHINHHLDVGMEVGIQMPSGIFTLPLSHSRPVVLIAGGIGITPFLSLLETLAADGAEQMPEITLLYANREPKRHAFQRRLKKLASQLPRLQILDFYNETETNDALPQTCFHVSKLNASLLAPWVERRARFYLCGPQAMMDDLSQQLIHLGAQRFEIFQEAFTPPPRSAMHNMQPRRVQLKRSQREFLWHPDHGTLLESAEQHKLTLPSGCRVGQCESCAITLLEGTTHNLAETPSGEEQQCLTCQSVPLSDIVLDI